MLLETALKDYLSLPCRVSPGPLPSQGGETLHPEKHSETPQFPQRDSMCVGHPKCVALPTASHSMSPTPATTAPPSNPVLPPVSAQLLSKAWLKWHHWGMVWKNLWLIRFTSRLHLWLKSDQKAGPHCHNSPPIYLKWVCPLLPMSKFQISLSLTLSVYISVCVYVSIYILQIYIYIFGVYYINWWWPLREAPIETFWGTI